MTSRTRSAEPILPGLMRSSSTLSAARSPLVGKWMSAKIGTSTWRTMCFNAARIPVGAGHPDDVGAGPAPGLDLLDGRPDVAGPGVGIDCTVIGEFAADRTLPTWIVRQGRRWIQVGPNGSSSCLAELVLRLIERFVTEKDRYRELRSRQQRLGSSVSRGAACRWRRWPARLAVDDQREGPALPVRGGGRRAGTGRFPPT